MRTETDPHLADSKDDVLVVLMNGDDLARLVEANDRSSVLKDFHQRAVMNGNGGH